MSEHFFSLIPFPASNIPAISITGGISLQDRFLSLHYSVAGNIDEILLPRLSARPSRRNDLWKATCFEFFLAIKDQPGYWEINLSPSGDWNVYRMDAYRRIGFREETAISELPFEFMKRADGYSLGLSLDLMFLPPSHQGLQMAITAIIQTKAGDETYWALAHPAPQADFHLIESFILALAGPARLSARAASGG
jgi:hypothetical protein